MNTAYIAILISCLSLMVAAFSLGWNIYRDVVLKARVKVSVSKVTTITAASSGEDCLMISAVNHGPGKVNLNIIRFMHRSFFKLIFRRRRHGVLMHDYTNPLSGQLPKIIEPGEKINLIFPWSEDNLISRFPTHIGIRDSYDRTHWAPRSDIRKTVRDWKRDFVI